MSENDLMEGGLLDTAKAPSGDATIDDENSKEPDPLENQTTNNAAQPQNQVLP